VRVRVKAFGLNRAAPLGQDGADRRPCRARDRGRRRGDLAGGAEVSLTGFGKFKVKETPEREGRNPASGERI
jgi:hypothetical protein